MSSHIRSSHNSTPKGPCAELQKFLPQFCQFHNRKCNIIIGIMTTHPYPLHMAAIISLYILKKVNHLKEFHGNDSNFTPNMFMLQVAPKRDSSI